jgi:uncharacterized protein YkwD
LLIAAALLASASATLFYTARLQADDRQIYNSSTAVMQRMVELNNDLRSTKELAPLRENRALEVSAQTKLQEMSTLKYWGHYTDDGLSFSRFIFDQEPNSELVGENLARCYSSHDAAFVALMKSPTHYLVMMGDFTDVGVASFIDKDGCEYIVMHYAKL